MSTSNPAAPRRKTISPLLLGLVVVAAIAGLSAVWAGAAVVSRSNASWMCLIAAVDAALLLRLAGFPQGARRAAYALLITLLTVLFSAALVAAAKVGMGLGLRPAESIGRMSLELIQLYVGANCDWVDGLWLLAGSVLAWFSGR